MLTPKENALRMIYDEKPEYIPMTFEAFRIIGMPLAPALEAPLMQDGYDPFGVFWHVDSLGGIPDNSHFLFEDITEWKNHVKIPDLSGIDFKGIAEKELEGVDRNAQLLSYYHSTGIWERAVSFMGFENTMVVLLEEPECFHDLLDVLTKYKIEVAKNIIDAYHPDVYVDFNDVATARSLFMSPECYREMIKPHQKEFIDYILSRGVLFEQHCCGKCEDIIEDYVEMGAKLWHSAQSMNDLKGIGKKYKGKLTIEGGWDSSGVPGMITATAEDMRNETRRCLEEYGHDASFILLPVMFSEEGNSVLTGRDARLPAVVDEWNKNKAL